MTWSLVQASLALSLPGAAACFQDVLTCAALAPQAIVLRRRGVAHVALNYTPDAYEPLTESEAQALRSHAQAQAQGRGHERHFRPPRGPSYDGGSAGGGSGGGGGGAGGSMMAVPDEAIDPEHCVIELLDPGR